MDTAKVETVIYKGIKFRRYPDSPHFADRNYFTPGIADKARGTRRLHKEIWMDANGAQIPDGHHVHHLDHDTSNNAPDNLALISASDHLEHHGKQPRSEAQLEWWREYQARAVEWHGSPAGRAWHSEHGKRTWEGREPVAATCEQCGSRYESLIPKRFCSNACKSAWRRDSGLDNIDRPCARCGTAFPVNRYSKQKYCSRSCSSRRPRERT